MGVRYYNPTTGTFTGPDPVAGGNDTSYGYPTDPINSNDSSGLGPGLYERMNRKEKELCAKSGSRCQDVYWISRWAEGTANRYFGRAGFYNSQRREAMRHMVWQALLTWKYGADFARAWGNAHEWAPSGHRHPGDSIRDQQNNSIGRHLGAGLRNKYWRVPWNTDNAMRAATKWALGRIRYGQYAMCFGWGGWCR